MKKILLSFTLLVCALSTVFAQKNIGSLLRAADEQTIPYKKRLLDVPDLSKLFGYADKSVDIPKGQWLGSNYDIYMTPAIKLPKMGAGNKLVGITFAYHDSKEPNGRIVLMEENEYGSGTVIAVKNVNIVAGWNSFKFDSPILLDPSKSYLLGYCVYAKAEANSSPICLDHQSENSCSLANRFATTGAYLEKGQSADFVETTDLQYGNYMIYADIDDSASPLNNGALLLNTKNIKAVADEPFDVEVNIRNIGKNDITSLDMDFSWYQSNSSEVHFNTDIKPGETKLVKVRYPEGRNAGNGFLFNHFIKVNGSSTLLANNTTRAKYTFYKPNNSIDRKAILVEEFTSETCENCPRVSFFMKKLLKQAQTDGNQVNIIAYHISDTFALKEANILQKQAFASGQYYFPALAYDRRKLGMDGAIVFDPNQNNVIEHYQDELRFMQPMKFTALLQEVKGDVLNLYIGGKVLDKSKFDDTKLSVVLTEDSIKSVNQYGASSSYLHNHVARAFATPVEGADLSIQQDGNFTITLNGIALNQSWKRSNMKVVVFVHRSLTNKEMDQREVWGTISLPLGQNLGAQDVLPESEPRLSIVGSHICIDGDVKAFRVFDMGGRIVSDNVLSQLEPGIYVVSFIYGQKQYAQKVVIR